MTLSPVSQEIALSPTDPCQILYVEILEMIFSRICMNQIVAELMLVSKVWRCKIGQCEILWKKYIIGPEKIYNTSPRSLATDLLGQYIRSIENHYIETKSITLLFELIAKNRFPNLQSLNVTGNYLSPLTQLRTHLLRFPQSLKSLRLDCINDPSISLFMVLKTFPKLSNLTYRNIYSRRRSNHQYTDMDPDIAAMQDSASVKSSTHLLTLELVTTAAISESTQSKMLKTVLSKCPELRGLTIAPCKNIGFLLETILRQPPYCPNLSFLAVNPLHRTTNVLNRFIHCQPLAAGYGGLTSLTIGPILVQDLAKLLLAVQIQASLEELCVYYDTQTVSSASTRIHPSQLHMRLSRLRVFTFHGRADTAAETAVLDAILAGSHHLESLTLISYSSTAPPPHMATIFQRLAVLQHLERVHLSCCPHLPELSIHYLDHMVALGHRCPLRIFSLNYGPLTQALLQQLGQIKTLQRVALVPTPYRSTDGLIEFLSQSSSIQAIVLDARQLGGDIKTAISQVANIKTLRQLSVAGTMGGPERALLLEYAKPYNISIQFNESR